MMKYLKEFDVFKNILRHKWWIAISTRHSSSHEHIGRGWARQNNNLIAAYLTVTIF